MNKSNKLVNDSRGKNKKIILINNVIFILILFEKKDMKINVGIKKEKLK